MTERYTLLTLHNEHELEPVVTIRLVSVPAPEEVLRTHPHATVVRAERIDMVLPPDPASDEYAGRVKAVAEVFRMAAALVELHATTVPPSSQRPVLGEVPS